MSMLVFGHNGQVATELRLQCPDAVYLSRDMANLSDPDACARVIAAKRPSVVINAAAWTAVDAAETEETAVHVVNALAPGAMATACAELNIPFLHLSSDYVFDGHGTTPWRESDPVSPLNAYGRTKLAGEEAIRAASGPHVILRCSWIFSAHGENFVKTMLRLSETHDNLRVVDDQIGGPTPARDIAGALLRVAKLMQAGHRGGTYHFGAMPYVSWADFAREIFARSNRHVTVQGIPTSEYPTPAQRPLNSRLDCATLTADFGINPSDWRTGLSAVLEELKATK